MNFFDTIKNFFKGMSTKESIKLLSEDTTQPSSEGIEKIEDIKRGPKLPSHYKDGLKFKGVSQVAKELGDAMAKFENENKPININDLINKKVKVNITDIADLKKALELVEKSYSYGNNYTGRNTYVFNVDAPISMSQPQNISLQKRAVNDYVGGIRDSLKIRNLIGQQSGYEPIAKVITDRMQSILVKTFGERVGLSKEDSIESVMARINEIFNGKLMNNSNDGIINKVIKGIAEDNMKDVKEAMRTMKTEIIMLVKRNEISKIEAAYCLTGMNSYIPLISDTRKMPRGYKLMYASELSKDDRGELYENPNSEIVFCGNGQGTETEVVDSKVEEK